MNRLQKEVNEEAYNEERTLNNFTCSTECFSIKIVESSFKNFNYMKKAIDKAVFVNPELGM